jgi:hypothetical protein
MRPISYISERPTKVSPQDADIHDYRYELLCDDGVTKVDIDVHITRTAREWVREEPDLLGEGVKDAVESLGKSVVDRWVLGQDDPARQWIVHGDHIFGSGHPVEPDRPV